MFVHNVIDTQQPRSFRLVCKKYVNKMTAVGVGKFHVSITSFLIASFQFTNVDWPNRNALFQTHPFLHDHTSLAVLGPPLARNFFITDRVRSTREGYVLTRVCPSIHPSICLSTGVRGTPARSSLVG